MAPKVKKREQDRLPDVGYEACEKCARQKVRHLPDPVLALRGLGKEIWVGEDADACVRRLRDGGY